MTPYKPLLPLLTTPTTTIILDGALATQLESLGANISDPLWSCKALLESPEQIRQIHLSYYLAGADVAITASYQATTLGLAQQRGYDVDAAKALIRLSVRLADEARREARSLGRGSGEGRTMLIAGSVGPYGAYLADGSEYRGDYPKGVTKDLLKDFHRPRMQALVESGADLLALETMPNLLEIETLVDLLKGEFSGTAAWVSLSLRADGNGEVLADGTGLGKVVHAIEDCEQVVAVGVNCVARELVTPALKVLRKMSKKMLLCYPNSGEVYDAESKSWSGERQENEEILVGWNDLVKEWRALGARLIGGCCRTGPEDIKLIKAATED